MLRIRNRRRAARRRSAVQRLFNINAAIVALGDDDLLDLADIFKHDTGKPLNQSAWAEMAKRGISLADDA